MKITLTPAGNVALKQTYPLWGAFLLMYIPAFIWLVEFTWSKENQAHGPIVFCIAMWLIYRLLPSFFELSATAKTSPLLGWFFFLLGCSCYIIGKSQSIDLILAASFIIVLSGIVLILAGWAGLRLIWFPLFFLLFMLPLPGSLVAALTLPMKTAVSYVAELLLYHAGYPVSRSGVIIQIGQYQMLVADACAGLHTLFTLEAIGLLYLNLMAYQNVTRNIIVALMVVPISFTANTIRVIILILITYYFGDEAGQGFLHGFAGIVLFGVALFLLMSFDTLLGFCMKKMGVANVASKK